jgi:hypothetical protein
MGALNPVCAAKVYEEKCCAEELKCSEIVAPSQFTKETVASGRLLFTFTLPGHLTGQIQ